MKGRRRCVLARAKDSTWKNRMNSLNSELWIRAARPTSNTVEDKKRTLWPARARASVVMDAKAQRLKDAKVIALYMLATRHRCLVGWLGKTLVQPGAGPFCSRRRGDIVTRQRCWGSCTSGWCGCVQMLEHNRRPACSSVQSSCPTLHRWPGLGEEPGRESVPRSDASKSERDRSYPTLYVLAPTHTLGNALPDGTRNQSHRRWTLSVCVCV